MPKLKIRIIYLATLLFLVTELICLIVDLPIAGVLWRGLVVYAVILVFGSLLSAVLEKVDIPDTKTKKEEFGQLSSLGNNATPKPDFDEQRFLKIVKDRPKETAQAIEALINQ